MTVCLEERPTTREPCTDDAPAVPELFPGKALLIRVDPSDARHPSIGATVLTTDITYDDGRGALRYHGATSVDGMPPEADLPFPDDALASGAYDFARITWMLVDPDNLEAGHVEVSSAKMGRLLREGDRYYWNEHLGMRSAG